jgi:nicotinamidase-related amidase
MDRLDLTLANTTVLAIDVQDRFVSAIPSIAEDQPVGKALRTLLAGANLLEVPVVISEQYPKGLGVTLPYLRTAAPKAEFFAKTHFSCLDDATLRNRLVDGNPRTHVVIAGIEAHVCLLGTVADLISAGKWVVVAEDAVDSRNRLHRDHAVQAMRDLGALVVPVETILFRLQRQAGVGAFKALSALVK